MSGTADFSVTLDEIPIKFSTVFKYLGDRLDNHLSFIVRWLKAQIYTEWTKAPNFAWL